MASPIRLIFAPQHNGGRVALIQRKWPNFGRMRISCGSNADAIHAHLPPLVQSIGCSCSNVPVRVV